jgi:hypothetical protein
MASCLCRPHATRKSATKAARDALVSDNVARQEQLAQTRLDIWALENGTLKREEQPFGLAIAVCREYSLAAVSWSNALWLCASPSDSNTRANSTLPLQRVWRDNEDAHAHAHRYEDEDEDEHEYLDVHQLADRRCLAAKDVTSRQTPTRADALTLAERHWR